MDYGNKRILMYQPRVDYDQIAHLYDEPLRDHPIDPNLLAYLEENPALTPADLKILDVGCGTGKQQTANKDYFPQMLVMGLDRFRGMVQIARQRGPNVLWMQGNGLSLPFPSRCFDYVTNQFSYPHIPDKPQFMRELFRVVRERGRVVLTNIDPWQMDDWPIYQFFPTARDLDYQDFWPAEKLMALWQTTGFANIRLQRQNLPIQQTLAEFGHFASQRHRSSQFMALTDEDYQIGLERIQSQLTRDAHTILSWQLSLITLTGSK